MAYTLTCWGGAGTVTGSKSLLELGDRKILVDCGLFQGLKELRIMNWENFPVDPRLIDMVLITHAHLDHVGALPLLVKNGFDGKILATAPTIELARIILYDSARLQEEEARSANDMGYSRHSPAKALYDMEDVTACLRLFEAIECQEEQEIFSGIRVRYLNSGHILGSAMIEVYYQGEKILFSGDIGRSKPLILHPPEQVLDADVLILESTYGDRLHPERPAELQLSETINDTLHRNGNIIIPSFSIERAQEIIFLLNRLKQKNMIPDVPVFLDSPMAIDASEIMLRYPQWHTLGFKHCLDMFENVTMIRDIRSTFQNIHSGSRKIIIAGSGMITGGRVLEYLKACIGHAQHTVLLVGYQAEGTRGRALAKGEKSIKIHGSYYPVAAEIKEISGLSGHADQQELVQWLKQFVRLPKRIFLNHGESKSSEALQQLIQSQFNTNCTVALMNYPYALRS
ncbi:MAG: MBL fold metallo-hydrolase [Cytophagaceae bacterium]|jgi:metallo-beta-lactamase family protein|nr:MBL fold metallo-hydrolase [Cytophagaceae bacterium]